ncbi:MAG TPA: hypothetical protein VG900_07495 [Hyphomicrobiaceae bacterium]|jgi:hypothetical protein|nr:hypothetical protein [Hyphomicrobiaceae bacterium]
MRTFVFLLALLAALKIGHQEYLFRLATAEAIVNAYKQRAVHACQIDTGNASLGLSPQAWSNPASVEFAVGKSNLDVRLWQVDNDLWNARYRTPYLFLKATSRSGPVYCEYDLVKAAASIHRM